MKRWLIKWQDINTKQEGAKVVEDRRRAEELVAYIDSNTDLRLVEFSEQG